MSTKKLKPRIQPWWNQDDEYSLATEIYETICFLEQDQQGRRQKNIQCLRLYGNADYMGTGPFQYTRTNSEALPENRVKMNIIASMVDTVAAKISKMKPKVTFLTSGGDFSVREKSRKLQKFILGTFYANKTHELHQQMFKDSLIFDIGAVKHFIDGKKICSERVLPTELYVDVADAMYGKPSHLYHVKYVQKDILIQQYPEHAAAIQESSGNVDPTRNFTALEEEREFVVVIEGWHLKGGRGGRGRHVIAVEKAVLSQENYKKDYFPFTFDRWTGAVLGFYGQSLAERLMGNQIEINKMLRVIQRSFHLGSSFKVFLEYGSKVAKEHVNNEIGSLIYYSGTMPSYQAPKVVHEEYFRHLEWLIKSSYEEAGVSQLTAASKIPIGMDGGSGKALREYNDLETERFILQAQEYEQTFLETARIYIDLARDIGDYEVVAESKRFMETINWSEIELENNEFIMQMFPTSMLPHTPSGRLAYVRELLQDGFIDSSWALSLLEFPDIEGYTSLKTAPLDDILDTLEQVLYKGKYVTPEPFQNLQLGIETFQMAYLMARKDNAPDDRLDDMRRWIEQAQLMLDQSMAMAQAAAPALPAGQALNASAAGAQLVSPSLMAAAPGTSPIAA
jgi:hypothetical protein